MIRRAKEEIKKGSFVKFTKDGIRIELANSTKKIPIGVAARDIKKYEWINYNPLENTVDMLVAGKVKHKEASGFERTSVGTIMRKYGRRWRLDFKWQIKPFHKCPHCKSMKTFHRERMKISEPEFQRTGRVYENCAGSLRGYCVNTMTLMKKDLCLKCGQFWVMEIFCWEKLGIKGVLFWDFNKNKAIKEKPWKTLQERIHNTEIMKVLRK